MATPEEQIDEIISAAEQEWHTSASDIVLHRAMPYPTERLSLLVLMLRIDGDLSDEAIERALPGVKREEVAGICLFAEEAIRHDARIANELAQLHARIHGPSQSADLPPAAGTSGERGEPRRISVDEVENAIYEVAHVARSELYGEGMAHDIGEARTAAIMLLREACGMSDQQIAHVFHRSRFHMHNRRKVLREEWDSNRNSSQCRVFDAVCRVLGLDAGEIIERDRPAHPAD